MPPPHVVSGDRLTTLRWEQPVIGFAQKRLTDPLLKEELRSRCKRNLSRRLLCLRVVRFASIKAPVR